MYPFATPDTPDFAGVINSVGQVYNLIYLSIFLGVTVFGFCIAILGVLLVKGVIDKSL